MLKAVFMDYYGTVTYENGPITMEVVKRVFENSDDQYIDASLKKHNLHPQGVITSEQAKYSKPRKEIFLYALGKTGLKPEEVIHIGDSLEGDVRCPGQAGISAIWLNREKSPVPAGVKNADTLDEAERMLVSL